MLFFVVYCSLATRMKQEYRASGSYTYERQKDRCSRHRTYKIHREFAKSIMCPIPAGCRVVDLGASFGTLVKQLKDAGYDAFGVDGTPGIEELTNGLVRWADLTDCPELEGAADWAVFTDVGEHIPPELEKKLLDNACRVAKSGIVVSWSNRHGSHWGHVNCHDEKWVIEQFSKRGWAFDSIATVEAQNVWKRNRRVPWVFRRELK